MRTPLPFSGSSAPFKKGETVVYYDGTLMQVTGCSRPLGCLWSVHVVHARTGSEFTLPAYAFRRLRDACRVIEGGLANIIPFPNSPRTTRGPFSPSPTGGAAA
jgi:hypothetical protein